jgi:hypothetical protein
MSQAELARQLTARLRRNIDSAAVNKILIDPNNPPTPRRGAKAGKPAKNRALAADELLAIAEITKYPVMISLDGALLPPLPAEMDENGLNEAYLVKLLSTALEWRNLPADQSRVLAASLVGAARRQPGRQEVELTDDQAQAIVLALASAHKIPPPK